MRDKPILFDEAITIIRDSFKGFNAEESREMLWKWFTIMVTENFSKHGTETKENLISFYDHLKTLIEAISVLDNGYKSE